MKNTITTERAYTTYDHAQIIAKSALRTMSRATGNTGKMAELRRDINGRDRRAISMYAAMDRGDTYTTDTGAPYVLIDGYDTPIAAMPDTMSDAYDLVNVAALAILEALPNVDHDAPHVLSDATRKAAYKAVHAYVWAQTPKVERIRKVTDADGITRTYRSNISRVSYVTDLKTDEKTGECVDAGYIRVTRYYDLPTWADNIDYSLMLETLKPRLKPVQRDIIHKRMQGKSVSQIAREICVSQQAVSKALAKIQSVFADMYPSAIKGFKQARTSKKA